MLPEMKQLDINGFSFKVVDGEARTLASSAVTSANAYTDEKIALLMDNSSEAIDSIMELAQAMKDNEDVVDALEQAIGGKASKEEMGAVQQSVTDLRGYVDTELAQTADKEHVHEEYIKVSDKSALINEVIAALPYYDGVVEDVPEVELISFTIGGTDYQAENGMSWVEWVESGYNTGGCYIDDYKVLAYTIGNDRYYVALNSFFVSPNDVIQNAGYDATTFGGSND